jgi:predicted amidophosphoribosyltransferase
MTDYKEKTCPKCGQKLRFPTHVGGIVMRCPSCGKEFHSDFKIGHAGKQQQPSPSPLMTLFEMPSRTIDSIARFLRDKFN